MPIRRRVELRSLAKGRRITQPLLLLTRSQRLSESWSLESGTWLPMDSDGKYRKLIDLIADPYALIAAGL